MACSSLIDLNPSREDWLIEAHLCRLWEAINFKNNNEVMGLEMIFVDSKGHSIQGCIRKVHMDRYKNKLEEGEIYAIKNFKVGASAAQYKVVPNDSRMYFNASTSVSKLSPAPNNIPTHVFFFSSDETHEERIGNRAVLTDIIGCVSGICNDLTVSTGTKKDIKLTAGDGRILKVTLWGNVLQMFNYAAYEEPGNPVIAIITSTTVRKFKGELEYTSTAATKIYFNLDIDEVKQLALRFKSAPPVVTILDHEAPVAVPLAEQMMLNRTTISHVLGLEWVSNNQEHTFTIMAEIVDIEHSFGWYYVSCNKCSKKLVADNGTFLCTACSKECSYPIIRYKIHVHVADETGSTTFVIFDQEAEKLLKKPANKHVARLAIDNKDLPHDIMKLTSRTLVFKIKVTDYNLKDGFENYTVMKIFDPNSTLDPKEGGSLKTQESSVDGKRKGGASSCSQASDADKAATGTENSMQPLTPAKKTTPTKKLKRTQ